MSKHTRVELSLLTEDSLIEGILVLPDLSTNQSVSSEGLLQEIKERVHSLQVDDIACREVEPGKFQVTITPATMLLSTLRGDISTLRAEVSALQAVLTTADDEIFRLRGKSTAANEEIIRLRQDLDALAAETRPFVNTVILFRKSIFETRLGMTNQHQGETIEDRNLAAHGGDIVVDVRMLEEVGKSPSTSDDLPLYHGAFRTLCGVWPREFPMLEKCKDMVRVLNIRATVELADRQFLRHVAESIRDLVDGAITHFNALRDAELAGELREGRLGRIIADVETKYSAQLRDGTRGEDGRRQRDARDAE